jgi:hypothetical protein
LKEDNCLIGVGLDLMEAMANFSFNLREIIKAGLNYLETPQILNMNCLIKNVKRKIFIAY